MLIDSHCHLDANAFEKDRDAVILRASSHSVSDYIVPAVNADSWKKIASLSDSDPRLHPAYGLHPCFLDSHQPEHLPLLADWLDQHQAIAVGECGLDYRDQDTDKAFQKMLFKGQLALAEQFNLPVIVHAVKAVTEVIAMIREFPGVNGVLHSFSGSAEQAALLADQDFYFGFGGPLTWDNARRVKRAASTIPLERILIESDAPDQAPQNHRGQRNEPAWIVDVVKELAMLHSKSIEEVAELTTLNARKLFNLNG